MIRIATDIEINAPPAGIWSVLTDFSSYPDWNPFIRSITGELVEGGRLKVTVKPPGGRAMTFHPRVVECVENRALRWRGSLLVSGLLEGEHYFQLEAVEPGRTRFRHDEVFTGLATWLFGGRLEAATRAGFVEMNQALKSAAEHA